MLTVIQRPDAYLYENNPPQYGEDPYYYSRWSAAHLPLVYKISNDKSPVNSFDDTDNYTGVFSTNGYATFDLSGTYQSYIIGSKVKVTGDVYDGIYEVKDVVAGEYIVLDVSFIVTDSGTLVKFFDNYQVLVKLYAGIATGHPLQSTDPMTYIGTFAIAPNPSNVAIIDVADLVKQKINQDCDINGTGRPNDLNSWTSFYIEYAETYDVYAASIPYTFTSDYETDLLDGCVPISITNGSFTSNLDGWSQTNSFWGSIYSRAWEWVSGAARVTTTSANTFHYSKYLYQEINFIASKQYVINFKYLSTVPSVIRYKSKVIIFATNSLSVREPNDVIYNLTHDGAINIDVDINFTLNEAKKYLIIYAEFPITKSVYYSEVTSISITEIDSEDCKAYIYAHNGTRQFYDLVKNQRTIYGGNMAEYVMNYNTQGILGKFLTRFETPTIFQGNYFDLSCIIPQTTLDIPFTEDGLVYRISQYSNDELVSTTDTEILNDGDGVYRLRLDDKITQEDSTVQLLRKQTNTDWDAIYLNSTDSFFVGKGNNFTEVALDSGYIAQDSFVYGVNSAVIVADNGAATTKVYSYIDNVLTTLTTQEEPSNFLYCVDNLNWVVRSNTGGFQSIVSINGDVTLETAGASYTTAGLAGLDINNVYLCSQNPFTIAQVRKRQSDGTWSLVFPFMSIGEVFSSDVPSRIAITNEYIYVVYYSSGSRVKKTNILTTSTVVYSLDANTEIGISALSDTEIVAVSNTHVFLYDGSSYVQDTDFDTLRTSSGDTGATITDCYYDATGLVTITTTERIYQKQNGTWTTGVGGDYVVGDDFRQYSARFVSENVVLEISEVKPIKLDTTCAKQSIYLSWINSLGNWEYFLFTARKTYEKVVENTTATRRNIYASFPDNFTSETEQDKIRIESYDKVTVRSQFVSKAQLDIITEIITSIRVQSWYSATEKITVIVDTQNVTKYSDGDKLYAIEFDIIYPMNQNISQ
jgi:hypothetical protein